jgi:hypothetical protein
MNHKGLDQRTAEFGATERALMRLSIPGLALPCLGFSDKVGRSAAAARLSGLRPILVRNQVHLDLLHCATNYFR